MSRRPFYVTLALLALLLAVPFLFRERSPEPPPGARPLVIISPHNESIRQEFGRAFNRWHRQQFGEEVVIDWRTPGGTSDIIRFLTGAYTADFRHQWTSRGGAWDDAIQNAVLDRKLKRETASADAWAARQAFLASAATSGVDLFFGGGQYDQQRLASMGVLVPCGLRERHPELFTGAQPLIPQSLGGEVWYDPGDCYYGVCVTAFGICYNPVRWQETVPNLPVPTRWADLGAPELRGLVALGDPSKSGSVAKAFEMLLQEKMADAMRAVPQDADSATQAAALAGGWDDALLQIRQIGANARYFTNSAGKVPLDVAAGDAAVGMCIDFYGRFQAEWDNRAAGREVLRYFTPVGGSSFSADPVSLLRGAPNSLQAKRFIDFLFTKEGQRLWNRRPGTPDGPTQYALRRLPIRRDLYSAEELAFCSDPAENPFELANHFTYHGGWTGPHFNLLRILLRVMLIDTHDELVAAWSAIQAAGGPDAVPAAMAEFRALPFGYADAGTAGQRLATNQDTVVASREWSAFFRTHYRRAAELANDSLTPKKKER